jgi:hypothetical protein
MRDSVQHTETYYKILNEDGTPAHGGTGKWSLPQNGQPGEWMPELTNLEPCERGYHVCTIDQLLYWLGPAIYIVECAGEHIAADDKHVLGRARLLSRVQAWNEQSARHFACDCAERVLHLYERQYPEDDRPATAIRTARAYAAGKATRAALAAAWAAARDAAWAAAGAAAGAAAWDAARAAAWDAALAAAWDAALAAAWDAAWDATWDAAWTAERQWQTARLKHRLR